MERWHGWLKNLPAGRAACSLWTVVAAIVLIGSVGIAKVAHGQPDGDGAQNFPRAAQGALPERLGQANKVRPAKASGSDVQKDAIEVISARYGVDAGLVTAVIRVESAFYPRAVSRKGATGLMQLMPKTALSLGVLDAFDPRENIEGGVRHLRYLLDRYSGNVMLALAAYNAGQTAVDLHRGVPPYPETQQYVQRVLQWAGFGMPENSGLRAFYRHEDADGTLTYSNLPPRPRSRFGR